MDSRRRFPADVGRRRLKFTSPTADDTDREILPHNPRPWK